MSGDTSLATRYRNADANSATKYKNWIGQRNLTVHGEK